MSGGGIVLVGWLPAFAANYPRAVPFQLRFKSYSCLELVGVPVLVASSYGN